MTVPGYWMNETSGILAPVVKRVINRRALDNQDVGIMRDYLREWMRGDFRGPAAANLRARVGEIRTPRELYEWLDDALDAGIDPL